MVYPFDQRFIFAVENIEWHENIWLVLVLSDGIQPEPALATLKEHGYSNEIVKKNIAGLKALNSDQLVNLAMLPDYRCEPALAALKTRATEDVFEKATHLSLSSLNTKRSLAVKILNSEHQKIFLPRTVNLLKTLKSTETDDLVIEQLGYAFSQLQIE